MAVQSRSAHAAQDGFGLQAIGAGAVFRGSWVCMGHTWAKKQKEGLVQRALSGGSCGRSCSACSASTLRQGWRRQALVGPQQRRRRASSTSTSGKPKAHGEAPPHPQRRHQEHAHQPANSRSHSWLARTCDSGAVPVRFQWRLAHLDAQVGHPSGHVGGADLGRDILVTVAFCSP